jgi:Family of unknown function (DUF5519)
MSAALCQKLWKALTRIDGVDVGSSVFADDDASLALWVDGKQITNFFADDGIEVRLTKKRISVERSRLKADPRIELRRNASDWLKVTFARSADIAFVRELVEIAIDAHRQPEGRRPRRPPAGAALARRRRFH